MAADLKCTHCGTLIAPGMRFCGSCGRDISSEQALVATAHIDPVTATGRLSISEADLLSALQRATRGEYEIMGELGRGGMAIVYLAHDIALERKVAIKVMSPSVIAGAGAVERFKREARMSAQLSHPHIIPIYGVRESEDILYFIMKFVSGRSLDSIIKERGQLPTRMVQAVITQAGSALGYAHRKGVVHRDIKPGNIMIDEEGYAVVADFGIAKEASAETLTQSGAAVGTPTYMSPQQCQGMPLTGASDQYSLGIVAYEMLAGRRPFDGESIMEIMKQHFFDEPPAIQDARPDCPEALQTMVNRMLMKEPDDRYPNLEEVVKAVGNVSLDADDPVRTQMVTWALEGAQAQRQATVATPKSPSPAALRETPSPPPPPTEPVSGAVKVRRGLAKVLLMVVLVLGGAGGGAWFVLNQLGESGTDGAGNFTDPGEALATGGELNEEAQPAGPPDDAPVATVPPLPGTVSVMNLPAGGTVMVDGQPRDRRFDIAAGRYEIQIRANGYEAHRQSIDVVSGETLEVTYPAQRVANAVTTPPPPTTATVTALNVPPGGQILLNGRLMGSRFELSAGTHTVLMTAPGYDTTSQRLNVVAGQPQSFSFTATERVDPMAGRAVIVVLVRATRRGRSVSVPANITIDGAARGEHSVYSDTLDAGIARHSIRVTREGFATFEQTFNVTAGTTDTLTVTLEPGGGS